MPSHVGEESRGADARLAIQMDRVERGNRHEADHCLRLLVSAFHIGPKVGPPGDQADGLPFGGALAGKNLPDVVVVSDVTWFNFALNQQLTPLDDLLALGLAYRRWAVEHASLYAVMFGGRVPPPEDCAEDGLAPLLGVVQRVADAGRLVGEDVHAAALAIWAATHGCVALELALWPDQPEELSARDFERQLAALTRAWILA